MKHISDQLDSLITSILDDHGQALRRKLREFVVELLGQLEALWPVDAGRRAQHFANLSHLVLFRLPGEEGSHREEFSHDAAHGEDVNGGVVIRCSEEDFGSSIPSGTDIVCEGRLSIDLFSQSENTTKLAFTMRKKLTQNLRS
jgi:hypothetical protein